MSEQLLTSVVTVITAIIGVAILAVLVSGQANTSGVIKAASSGFAQDLQAALSPVTGGGFGGLNLGTTSLTFGG
jgi:hypothetical protein